MQKQNSPQEQIFSAVKKAKLQTLNAVLFAFSFLLLFMNWYSLDYSGYGSEFLKGYDLSFNFFESSSMTDLIVGFITLAGIVAAAALVYMLNQKSVAHKNILAVTTLSAIAGALNILLVTVSVLKNNEDEISVGFVYYLYIIVNLVIVAANGFVAYTHKDEVMVMANAVKSEVEKKVDDMKSAMPEDKKEDKKA